MVDVRIRGLKRLAVSPGRATGRPSPAAPGFGCVARAMARWSASPKRRIRVPMSQRKGEWYLEPSKR